MTSLVVQQESRASLYHSQYGGGVHLRKRMKWRVKAVGSPVRSLLCPQTVAVGRIEPS